MAKPLELVAGTLTEVPAVTAPAGAGDAGKLVQLDGSGRLPLAAMPSGVGPDTLTATASEALAAGDLVNLHGASQVRRAVASGVATVAHGFVLAAVTSGASATVYFNGVNASVTGQTTGKTFLSPTVAGKTQTAAPSGTGQVVQCVGTCTSATALAFDRGEPVVLA